MAGSFQKFTVPLYQPPLGIDFFFSFSLSFIGLTPYICRSKTLEEYTPYATFNLMSEEQTNDKFGRENKKPFEPYLLPY